MKHRSIVFLLVALLFAAFPSARDLTAQENPAERHRFLSRGLAHYLGKADLHSLAGVDVSEAYVQPWMYSADGLKRRDFFGVSRFGEPGTPLPTNISPFADLLVPNAFDQADTAWVRHYAASLASGVDVANDVAVDDLGNVYVTGYSTNLPFGTDYLTIKYNATGAKVWEARYNGFGNGDNVAVAIAVDKSGNAYVTGRSWGSSTHYDYATIKYNSNGAEQWVARYNGPENFFDEVTDLAIDSTGNVYVKGRSWRRTTGYDYATIKYDTDGVEQWIVQLNGAGFYSNEGSTLAVDDSGNVYVAGFNAGAGTGSDYVTIKYSTTGVQQWAARYNGPANSTEAATALTIDPAGNVYVTGWSANGVAGSNYADYATVKYNNDGVEQWAARYNGPANGWDIPLALAVDPVVTEGNVYVTGIGYATVKYNADGVRQWEAHFGDWAVAIAADAAGNVYVGGWDSGSGTGPDYATVQYNSAGVQQWIARYNGPENSVDEATALAIDGNSNIYITGMSIGTGTGSDYTTVKYNSAGVRRWVARHNGPGTSLDVATAVAVDAESNIYVTGWSEDEGRDVDYATIKYNSSGEQQWVTRYNGPGNSSDRAYAIAVDASGNVYVTGESWGAGGTGTEYATIKYNRAGKQQWVARYDGPGNAFDVAIALAVDAAGNVYVTGRSFGSGTSYDYATIKYNSAGVRQWVARYNGPVNSSDLATAVVVDTLGNVYVTGSSAGSGTGSDYATIKYNSSGVQQWVARYNGPANSTDFGIAIDVDPAGNVYVTGSSDGANTRTDYATIKYGTDGVEQWVARYNGPGNSTDRAAALVLDATGNLYVTGSSGSDYATIKYNADGTHQWVARFNGPGDFIDEATDLAVDVAGNVYVTGWGWGSDRSYDYATVKYNSEGTEQWVAGYNSPDNSTDRAAALILDAAGNIYVTGSSSGTGWSVYTTVKYEQKTPAPSVPILVSPADGAVNQSTTLTLIWNPSPDAETYHLQVSTSSDFATAIVDDSTLTTIFHEVGPLANNTTYYWHVNAKNVGGTSAWSSVWSFMTIIAAPSTPLLATPADGAVNQPTTLALSWNPSTNAEMYRLQVSTSPNFATTIIDDSTITTTSRQVGPLANNTTYYWRVRAKNIGGISAFSEIRNFTTIIQLPSQVVLLSPPHGAVIEANSVQFTWRQSQPSVNRYWFEIATDSLMTNPVIDSTLTAGDTTKVVEQLVDEQTYWWRVRAGSVAGWGPFSEQRRFGIDIPTDVDAGDPIPREFNLSQNYPNPFNPTTTIKYELPQQADVKLEIFDMLGRQVRTLVNRSHQAGYYIINWDGRDEQGQMVASGVFFYQLRAGSFVQTRKMALVR